MQVNPALPWANSQGGTIQLETPVTVQQLLDGALVFTVVEDEGGDPTQAEVYRGFSDRIVIGDTRECYEIASFEGSTNTLTLTSVVSVAQLINVEKA